jgi:hypothetical protein
MFKCQALIATTLLTLALTLGCRIESDKHGDSDNVKIATPFGGMSVKTNDAVAWRNTGLQPYPGAVLVKQDKDSGAADINFSFGSFQLRVNAVSYRTSDSPAKVTDFYRTALASYGDVIQCSGRHSVGTPTQTAEGLTCDDDSNKKVNVSDDPSAHVELKAGSKTRQHLVEISPDGNGTKFGLVALDLPSHVTLGEEKDDTRQ